MGGLAAGLLHADATLAASCPPGTPSAARITGLPHRIEFGPREIFAVTRGSSDHYVDSEIRVRMTSRGRVFFDDETGRIPVRLFVQLVPRDRSARIAISFRQVAYDDPDVQVPCRMTLRRTVRGYRHMRIARCGSRAYRPRTIVIACGDGNFGLTELRWRHWNKRRARARGVVYANDCIPYCAAGHFSREPTRVVAYRPRPGPRDHYQFTRLRFVYDGRWRTLRVNQYGYWG